MDKNKLKHFKTLLMKEKNNVYSVINDIKKNETEYYEYGLGTELSHYDNHPADEATELFQKEMGITLSQNEQSLINKINKALESIDKGTYGVCQNCGRPISEKRLNIVPYATYCVDCQTESNNVNATTHNHKRPIEEKVLGYPFGYGYNDCTSKVEYDAEDCYQDVDTFNERFDMDYYFNDHDQVGYVEKVEEISNDYYKNQLP